MPHHKIMKQFGCHIHFKTLLAVLHPNPNIFTFSHLDELELDHGEKEGKGTSPFSPSVTPPLTRTIHVELWQASIYPDQSVTLLFAKNSYYNEINLNLHDRPAMGKRVRLPVKYIIARVNCLQGSKEHQKYVKP